MSESFVSVRDWSRSAVGAVIAGAVIGVILWAGHPHAPLWPSIVVSAYIGACIWAVMFVLVTTGRSFLRRLAPVARTVTLGLLFFFGGSVGWMLAFGTLPLISGGRFELSVADLRIALGFTGFLGLVVGSLSYAFETMRTRLEKSIALGKEQEFAARELQTARELQERLLPPVSMDGDGYSVRARSIPAAVVAGDFYDVIRRTDGKLNVAVADVAGKGMAASLIMASVKAILPLLVDGRSPSESLNELNRQLRARFHRRDFVALCLVEYDPATGAFELANAALPDPYLIQPGSNPKAIPVPGPRLPLGSSSRVTYESTAGTLQPGESLLLLTDGLPETVMPDGSYLGYEHLELLMERATAESSTDLLDQLFSAADASGTAARSDDCTGLVLRRNHDSPSAMSLATGS